MTQTKPVPCLSFPIYKFLHFLEGVERAIKIHPYPSHKHRPEITDFPITKNTVLGQ